MIIFWYIILYQKRCYTGDLSSPTIFVLCIEYLAITLRQNTEYCPLKIGTALIKVSLFFNNTDICLNDNATEFRRVFTILAFSSKSGCKVNLHKSCAFYLGASKKNIAKPYHDIVLL